MKSVMDLLTLKIIILDTSIEYLVVNKQLVIYLQLLIKYTYTLNRHYSTHCKNKPSLNVDDKFKQQNDEILELKNTIHKLQ